MNDQNMNSSSSRELLRTLLRSCDQEGCDWVCATEAKLNSAHKDDLLSLTNESLHAIRRTVSRRFVVISFADRTNAVTASPFGDVPIGHWKRDELAQVYLVAQVMSNRYETDERFAALYRLYDASDTEGRVACLRALNFMTGKSKDALTMINDAGRTYLSALMEAAWCSHPYASQTLSLEELRKAVLKAIFCEVSIESFMGIDRLADPELSRRLAEFANEREAAGRTVPAEVWRVASYHPVPGLVARLIGKVEHPDREERLNAALCLGRTGDPISVPFIDDRLKREDDAEVAIQLQNALEQLQTLS